MRTLVTGATGFIGYEVARQLAEQGLRPRLLVRRVERGMLLRPLDAEIVAGDLESPESLTRALEGMEAVIHLGARATFEEYNQLQSSIVGGTRDLARLAATAGVRRFVYGSSLFVHGSQEAEIDETTPTAPRLAYGRAKVAAEEILAAAAATSQLSTIAVRLPHVYGARDLFFSKIAQGRVLIPGRGNNLFSHLHVHDAARLLIAATGSDLGGNWPVADDRPTPWHEFFSVVRNYYPRFRYHRLPAFLALWGTRMVRPFQKIRGHPTILTPGSVVGWNLNLAVKTGILWRELGLQPDYPTIHQGIPAALDECVSFRWLHPVDDHSR